MHPDQIHVPRQDERSPSAPAPASATPRKDRFLVCAQAVRHPGASLVDAAELDAYLATEFRVRAAESFTLRIGEHSAPLFELQSRLRTPSSAFVTACNPAGAEEAAEENHRRHEVPRSLFQLLGHVHFEGHGAHPSNGWSPEPGFLVFGITFEADLALRLGQDAVVWSGEDVLPLLLVTR
ncbi:MAG: DUF3293 domain-containing protein [Planctomycetota bacterium]